MSNGHVGKGAISPAQRTVTELLAAAGVRIGGNAPQDVTVHDPSFYARVLRDPDMQLGVTYMDGLWDCKSLDELTARLTAIKAKERLFTADVITRTPLLLAEAAARHLYRDALAIFFNRQTITRSTNVAKEHYDVGNPLYARMLGPTLAYTSGVYADGYTLEDAQNAKHDLLCRKMGLKPGDRVLDIGCGFGGFARYAAKHYGAEVVGITISNEQLKLARALSKDIGGVSFIYSDYRDLAKRFPKDHFDHVVSIEMIEAVGPKNFRGYFECAQACLKPGGSFALQAILEPKSKVRCNAWMGEYIFRDGLCPSREQIDTAAADWFGAAEDVQRITDSYDKTLLAWHANFEAAWPELRGERYNDRFKRMQDMYLLGIAGGFRSGHMNVDQFVFRKGGPDASVKPVREMPSRAKLDALRATPEQVAAIRACVDEVEAHTQAVDAAAKPRPPRDEPLAKNAAICVVGAGPSGLSVAHDLRSQGYANVTVLEADDRVGGKSFTVRFNGREHDMGATMGVPRMYDGIVALGLEHGVHTTSFPQQVQYDLSTGKARPPRTFSETAAFYAGALRYMVTNFKARNQAGDGLEVPHEDLAEPLGIVASRQGFEAFAPALDTYLTGYGYGFPGDTPSVFGMRMLGPQTIVGAGSGELLMWKHGTTPIWEGVAKDLDVKLSTPVRRLESRDDGTAIVHTAAGKQHFDRVVVACDLKQSLEFIDAPPEQQQLFGLVKHMPYSTFACRVRGVADGRAEVGYLRENMREDRAGHPMAWIKRYPDDDLCIFHLFAPEQLSDADVVAKIRGDMEKLGATSVELVEARRWKFFPHVDGDAMRMEKFFERARNLQGEGGIFYANEVLSMSTMANVHQFAKTIADRVAQSG
ncbi:MAG: FAD-dependent oxidoreductase [Myxococcota bacterium]